MDFWLNLVSFGQFIVPNLGRFGFIFWWLFWLRFLVCSVDSLIEFLVDFGSIFGSISGSCENCFQVNYWSIFSSFLDDFLAVCCCFLIDVWSILLFNCWSLFYLFSDQFLVDFGRFWSILVDLVDFVLISQFIFGWFLVEILVDVLVLFSVRFEVDFKFIFGSSADWFLANFTQFLVNFESILVQLLINFGWVFGWFLDAILVDSKLGFHQFFTGIFCKLFWRRILSNFWLFLVDLETSFWGLCVWKVIFDYSSPIFGG